MNQHDWLRLEQKKEYLYIMQSRCHTIQYCQAIQSSQHKDVPEKAIVDMTLKGEFL